MEDVNYCNITYHPHDEPYFCDSNHTEDIVVLSDLCVNEEYNEDLSECLSKDLQDCYVRKSLGSWGIFMIVVGCLGNILTLLAIPYAASRKR